MNREVTLLATSLVGVILIWWMTCCGRGVTVTREDILRDVTVQPELRTQGQRMDKQEIIKVTEGVYVALNYALSNSILLEGPDGLIIVDTTESVEAAARILREFRRISSKPIVAIVHTHNHGDHTYGTEAFIEDVHSPPDIWGYETEKELALSTIVVGTKTHLGAIHQFGYQLGDQQISAGLGRRLVRDAAKLPLFPNRLVHGDGANVGIAGLNVTFIHIPGETKDQIGVWLADSKVLLPADDIYRTFPNLYAIRGTPPRDSLEWHDSLAKMRSLRAEHLVPSHTVPVSGAQSVYDLFTVYMAGIQFVHDQTIRHLNKGLHPDDISQRIKLPESLASHEYLQQFYGTTIWSSKGVYEQYIGWFSGDPVELLPNTPLEKARLMVEMVGADHLLTNAEAALKTDNSQWALELSSFVFKVAPDNMRAKSTRLDALRALAGKQTNPLARNFYLTVALADFGHIDTRIDRSKLVDAIEVKHLINLMKTHLKAEDVDGVNMTVVFNFTDIQETFRLQILYSVLTVESEVYSPGGTAALELERTFDAKITMTTQTWKDLVLQRRSAVAAYASGAIEVNGSLLTLGQFLAHIEKDN